MDREGIGKAMTRSTLRAETGGRLSAHNHPAGEEMCMNMLAKWNPIRVETLCVGRREGI